LHALEREHRNAILLQRSLLPSRLGTVAGVTVAARYLPARDEVGGDWYDTIELARGTVGVVIGDVVGHGLDAATLMGQLRTALRAYALDGNGPGRTLELLDRYAVSLEEEAMASVAYALLDSDTGQVRFASAGHLPPVIIASDGTPRLAEIAPAPPIGAFGYDGCAEHELSLMPGETMLLYTDGLVEQPRVLLPVGIEQLVVAVRGAATAEEACLMAMDALLPQRGPRDDVAVIAVRNEPVPDKLDVTLPAYPRTLGHVRHALARWMRAQELEREVTTEVTIAVSEACANAIEHAYGPRRGTFRVRARRAEGEIVVTVNDAGSWRAPRGENRGRGLKIMEAAMDSLDVRADTGGTEITMRRRLT
jgi:anti-sigma regulatory factor (Ser/Thr protein kinase)